MDLEFNEDACMDLGFLEDFIGKRIQVERGGPDKVEGILLATSEDYLALQDKDGYTYVACAHIKSITVQVVRSRLPELNPDNIDLPEEAEDADTFAELLGNLRNRLVRINRGGPNHLQGVVLDVQNDTVTILHDMKEMVHFPLHHVKSVSPVEVKGDGKDGKDGKNGNNDKDSNKGGNDKRNNRSRRNRRRRNRRRSR